MNQRSDLRWRFIPKGFRPKAKGLRGTSYPGWAVLVVPTPTGLWRARRFVGHNPVGVEPISPPGFPRVARSSQPWAGGHNPIGIDRRREPTSLLANPCRPQLSGRTTFSVKRHAGNLDIASRHV